MEFMPIFGAVAPFSTDFTNSFVTTPICCPSRASLLTGLYVQNHGVLHLLEPLGGFENFNDTSTLATWLNTAGYNTAMIGKYLNGYDKTSDVNQDPNNTYVPPGWDQWRAFLGASFTNATISVDGVSTFFPQSYSTDVFHRFRRRFHYGEQSARRSALLLVLRLTIHMSLHWSPIGMSVSMTVLHPIARLHSTKPT